MSVVTLPIKPYVAITKRMVAETRHHSCVGTVVVRHDPLLPRFYLDFVESEGSCCVWDGPEYAGAVAAAREWAVCGIGVRDQTGAAYG